MNDPRENSVPVAATDAPERRSEKRNEPAGAIRVNRVLPVLPLSDVQVVNVSRKGLALHTRTPLRAGERLSFAVEPHAPPILAEVMGVEPLEDGLFRVRCRALLGDFERAARRLAG